MTKLGPEANRIFRITHICNVPSLLAHGIHSRSSPNVDPGFISIGIPGLIDGRARKAVPIAPGGTLADYVPFYFTPHSMMLMNIKTGYNGVVKRPNSDIVILVSSLDKLAETGCIAVFTDGHAYMNGTHFYSDRNCLDRIDWNLLRRRDFKKSADDVDKSRRYQAEALAHRHVPASALLGIACYDPGAAATVQLAAEQCGLSLSVRTLPSWYF